MIPEHVTTLRRFFRPKHNMAKTNKRTRQLPNPFPGSLVRELLARCGGRLRNFDSLSKRTNIATSDTRDTLGEIYHLWRRDGRENILIILRKFPCAEQHLADHIGTRPLTKRPLRTPVAISIKDAFFDSATPF